MAGGYSLRSPAVKRLMKEAQELKDSTEQFFAQPLDDNLFEWHFTIRGPADSEFESGIYHGRIILPPEYPMKPPSIILLTPNGRFETNKKICLSISGHHPESWQPSWSLRTALLAIIGFMPTHGNGAIGSLDYTADERKVLARKSLEWKCPNCGPILKFVLPVTEASKALNKEAKELGSQINLQGEKEKEKSAEATAPSSPEAGTAGTSTLAGDQSGAAGGPAPSLNTMPSLFPYPIDPRLMFPMNPAQQPNALGFDPSNLNNPMMPPMFMPPFFFPNMYNPLLMQPPRYPGTYAPQGYPPGYPMPGFWPGSGPYPPTGAAAAPCIQEVPPNTVSPLVRSSSSVPSAGTGSSEPCSGNQAQSSQQVASVQTQTSTSNTAVSAPSSAASSETNTVSTPSSAAVSESNMVASPELTSSPVQPSQSPPTSSRAEATSNANAASNAEPDDPIPSASELRQRNLGRGSGRTPPGVVRRTNQPAEIRHGRNSTSYDGGRLMLNILVAVLVLCIVALLSRRIYILGKP